MREQEVKNSENEGGENERRGESEMENEREGEKMCE